MTYSKAQDALFFQQLQTWYAAECNGDWEHSYGVKIETLDNPGWLVTIDLIETAWEELSVSRETMQESEQNWVSYEISNKQFIGAGGSESLGELIFHFLRLTKQV